MAEELTEGNGATEGATAIAETPIEQPEATTQEPNAKVAEFERMLNAALERAETEARARVAAEAEAKKWENTYKGLQKEATPKLQELAKLRAQAATDQATQLRFSNIEKMMQKVFEATIPEEERAKLQERIEIDIQKEQIKAQQEALASAAAVQPGYADQETRKREALRTYFPDETDVDVNDPRLDLAEDAPNFQQWFARVSNSITKIKTEKIQQASVMSVEELRKQAEEAVKAAKAEAERVAADAKAQISEATVAATQQARAEKEAQLRALGADVADTARPEGSQVRSIEEQYPLDESWLMQGPAGQARFETALKARKQALQAKARR